MTKYAFLVMFGAALTMTSCGEDPKPVEETKPVELNTGNEMMDNLMEQGLNKAFEEVSEQIADSTSDLNMALDTLKDVIEDNQDLIEEAVGEGLENLNKSF